MRISDWSSDVCSSDLHDHLFEPPHRGPQIGALGVDRGIVHQQLVLARAEALEDRRDVRLRRAIAVEIILHLVAEGADPQIGRASCRERVGQYVSISVVAESFKKNNTRCRSKYVEKQNKKANSQT